MFIFGILSLIQIGLLPGLISLRLLRFRGTFWQSVIYTFALSMTINYCSVFLLAALHLYIRPVILTLFVAEVIWTIWLYREDLRKPIFDVFQELWKRSISALTRFIHFSEDEQTFPKATQFIFSLFTLISFVVALERIWWAWKMYLGNWGTVFDAWDTVFLWNQWAEVWSSGRIPLDLRFDPQLLPTRFYPQLVPANWSLTYLFIGDSSMQFFAKSIMPLFFMGLLLQFLDLGISLRQPGFFVAIIFLRSLFVRFIEAGLYNGFVDTAVAFFGFLPIYTIIKAQATKTDSEMRLLWILGFFFAAAATVTKQAGVYIFLIYPVLLYAIVLRSKYGNWLNPSVWKSVLTWGASAAIIPLVWYGLKLILMSQGADAPEITGITNISAQVYGNVGLASQIILALKNFGKYIVLFPLILCALPLMPSIIRWLFVLFTLPFPVLWSVMASYDFRNLAIFFPVLALSSGLALEALIILSQRLLTKARLEKWTFVMIPLGAVAFLFAMHFLYPDSRIRAADMNARQEVFSPSLNRELNKIFFNKPDALILTNYPVDYVLGRKNSQVSFWYTDAQEFKSLMQNEKITHLLVPSSGVNAEIMTEIEQRVNDGHLTFVLQDKGSSVIPYRLYIVRR